MQEETITLNQIKKNDEEMKIAYAELNLYLNFSITDFNSVALAAKELYEKRLKMYSLVIDGLSMSLRRNRSFDVPQYEINKFADYGALLKDKCLENKFKNELEQYMLTEVEAMKMF